MIEATAGLQTSQPSPPRGALTAVAVQQDRKEGMRSARATSYSSSRVREKQPHRPWSTSTPLAASSSFDELAGTLTNCRTPYRPWCTS